MSFMSKAARYPGICIYSAGYEGVTWGKSLKQKGSGLWRTLDNLWGAEQDRTVDQLNALSARQLT